MNQQTAANQKIVAEEVVLELEGASYRYFMTNDQATITQRLRSLGCRAPQDSDFKEGPAQLKPVHDAMLQLGATYSLTVSNNVYAMNRCLPEQGLLLASLLDLCDTTSTEIPPRAEESLMLAVARNDASTVARLVQEGAAINEVSPQGLAPLMVAARFNAQDAARILLDNGAQVDIKTFHGRTSLCYAAGQKAMETARLLMERNADVNNRDDFGVTPLIAAIRSDSLELAALLIQGGANVNLGGVKNTPLLNAIGNNSLAIIRLLIDHGVNVNRRDLSGTTPLTAARNKGFTEAAQLLIDAGAH